MYFCWQRAGGWVGGCESRVEVGGTFCMRSAENGTRRTGNGGRELFFSRSRLRVRSGAGRRVTRLQQLDYAVMYVLCLGCFQPASLAFFSNGAGQWRCCDDEAASISGAVGPGLGPAEASARAGLGGCCWADARQLAVVGRAVASQPVPVVRCWPLTAPSLPPARTTLSAGPRSPPYATLHFLYPVDRCSIVPGQVRGGDPVPLLYCTAYGNGGG